MSVRSTGDWLREGPLDASREGGVRRMATWSTAVMDDCGKLYADADADWGRAFNIKFWAKVEDEGVRWKGSAME